MITKEYYYPQYESNFGQVTHYSRDGRFVTVHLRGYGSVWGGCIRGRRPRPGEFVEIQAPASRYIVTVVEPDKLVRDWLSHDL